MGMGQRLLFRKFFAGSGNRLPGVISFGKSAFILQCRL
jgi:hypothetical protein